MKRKDWTDIVILLVFFLILSGVQWLFARQFNLLYPMLIFEFICIAIMWLGARMKRSNVIILAALALLAPLSEILQWRSSRQFDWPYLWTIIEIILVKITWDRCPILRKIVGENDAKGKIRRPSWILILNLCLWLFLFVPLSLYLLTTEPSAEQFSIITIAPVLGGLVLAAASIMTKPSETRTSLLRVAQKFISATVLFILFIPFIYVINLWKGINPNSFQWNDVTAWFRGIYFWLAAPCFFLGEALFLFGLTDLIYALIGFEAIGDTLLDTNLDTTQKQSTLEPSSHGVDQLEQDPNKLPISKNLDENKPQILYHYTTQEGMLGIIKEGALWASHIFFLNDSNELIEPLRIASETIEEYRTKLTEKEMQTKKEEIDRISAYNSYSGCLFFKMFVTSFCNNGDLLSQWRGYGTYGSAYAIGFNREKLKEIIDSNNFRLLPCEYLDKEEYSKKIKNSILGIVNRPDQLSPTYSKFLNTAATTKLDCFKEENEWRIISTGRISDNDENIRFRSTKSMIVPYYSLKLGDLSSIVEIRIGPCQNPQLAQDAIYRLKERYNIKNLNLDNIKISTIPYRVF